MEQIKREIERLIEQIKKDFDFKICDLDGNLLIIPYSCVSKDVNKEKYKYYKNLFNLKEEGEENE